MADEEYREDQEDYEEEEGGFKTWLQDNIRIILAVLIVALIAVGLYSYSQRVPGPGEGDQETAQEETQEGEEEVSVTEETEGEEEVVTEEGDVAVSGEDQEVQVGNGATTTETGEGQTDQSQGKGSGKGKGGWTVEEEQAALESGDTEESQTSQTTQNTGEVIVVTAQPGDSITTMARKALGEYVNQTGETGLNAQHKVFVEDYLRKRVSQHRVSVGQEVSFSKSMIQEAIQGAKNLNQSQLSYLERFSSRVPSL